MQAFLQHTVVVKTYMPDEKQKPPNSYLRAFLFNCFAAYFFAVSTSFVSLGVATWAVFVFSASFKGQWPVMCTPTPAVKIDAAAMAIIFVFISFWF